MLTSREHFRSGSWDDTACEKVSSPRDDTENHPSRVPETVSCSLTGVCIADEIAEFDMVESIIVEGLYDLWNASKKSVRRDGVHKWEKCDNEPGDAGSDLEVVLLCSNKGSFKGK